MVTLKKLFNIFFDCLFDLGFGATKRFVQKNCFTSFFLIFSRNEFSFRVDFQVNYRTYLITWNKHRLIKQHLLFFPINFTWTLRNHFKIVDARYGLFSSLWTIPYPLNGPWIWEHLSARWPKGSKTGPSAHLHT